MTESIVTEQPVQAATCSCGCCGPQPIAMPVAEQQDSAACDCGCSGSGCTCDCGCCG